jgi:hypothetical protein
MPDSVWSADRAALSGCRRQTCDRPPLLESLVHRLAVTLSCETVPPWTEMVAHRAEGLQEPLRLLRRLESLHRSLALAYRPMRVLGPVVEPLVPPVLSVRQGALDGWHVAGKLVRDHNARLHVLGLEYSTQEPLRGVLVASALDQDVQHRPILTDSAPQPVPTFLDGQRHLVQEPLVAASPAASTKLASQQRAELVAPETNRLVADLDASLGEQLFDIAVAQREAVIQPDRVADDLGRER